jgi:hypothetical protein
VCDAQVEGVAARSWESESYWNETRKTKKIEEKTRCLPPLHKYANGSDRECSGRKLKQDGVIAQKYVRDRGRFVNGDERASVQVRYCRLLK